MNVVSCHYLFYYLYISELSQLVCLFVEQEQLIKEIGLTGYRHNNCLR